MTHYWLHLFFPYILHHINLHKTYTTKNMITCICAAKHMCLASHVPMTPIHRCRQCGNYLHVFCAGKGINPPDDDAQNGLEYDCILCCGGIPLGRFNAPPNVTDNSVNILDSNQTSTQSSIHTTHVRLGGTRNPCWILLRLSLVPCDVTSYRTLSFQISLSVTRCLQSARAKHTMYSTLGGSTSKATSPHFFDFLKIFDPPYSSF